MERHKRAATRGSPLMAASATPTRLRAAHLVSESRVLSKLLPDDVVEGVLAQVRQPPTPENRRFAGTL